jgi:hypothetical protein
MKMLLAILSLNSNNKQLVIEIVYLVVGGADDGHLDLVVSSGARVALSQIFAKVLHVSYFVSHDVLKGEDKSDQQLIDELLFFFNLRSGMLKPYLVCKDRTDPITLPLELLIISFHNGFSVVQKVIFTQFENDFILGVIVVNFDVIQVLAIGDYRLRIGHHHLVMLVIQGHLMDALLLWATATAVLENDQHETVLIETVLVCVVVLDDLVTNDVEEIAL